MTTAPSTIFSGVGLRDVQIFVLDSNGYPAASTTAAYAGVDVTHARNIDITDPEPRAIVFQGDDHIFALDSLPPTEALVGTLRTAAFNDALDEALTGNKSVTIAESKFQLVNTDLKGLENQVGLVVYQQAIDDDPNSANYGKRYWHSMICPKAWIIPLEPGFNDNPTEKVYAFRPQICTKHLWGAAFAAATEGATQAQLVRGVHENKPRFVAFKADGTTTTFTLGQTAVSTTQISVWDNGVVNTSGVAPTTTTLVFTPAPTADHMIVAMFQVANTSGDNS